MYRFYNQKIVGAQQPELDIEELLRPLPYYHSNLTTDTQAEQYLKTPPLNNIKGCFLLRPSVDDIPGSFTASFISEVNKVNHMLFGVSPAANGKIQIREVYGNTLIGGEHNNIHHFITTCLSSMFVHAVGPDHKIINPLEAAGDAHNSNKIPSPSTR